MSDILPQMASWRSSGAKAEALCHAGALFRAVFGTGALSNESLPGSLTDPAAISPTSVKRYAVVSMVGSHYDGVFSVSKQKKRCTSDPIFTGSRTERSRYMAAHDDGLPMAVSNPTLLCGWQRSLAIGKALQSPRFDGHRAPSHDSRPR